MKAQKTPAEAVTIVVVGGAGAMGRITVKDLVETAPENVRILIADYNEAAAKKLAKSFRGRSVDAVFADVTNHAKTVKALRGAFAVINCAQHKFNLQVMKACLAVGAHYCDLGGLFHVARKQLELDAQFKKANLLAILGIGAAPGVVNVLARSAADGMDEVHEIHCMVGGIDRTRGRPAVPLGTSYTLETIIDEATMPAALFTGGKFTFVEAMSDDQEVEFPLPVGVVRPARTLHSEVATLPLTYRGKGIREVSFKIAFSPELEADLRFMRAVGMFSDEPVQVGKVKVSPRAVLQKVVARQPKPEFDGEPDEYEIVRAVVRGVERSERVEYTVDCHTPGIPIWGLGIDVDTGCPPSIVMQMLARGQITARGAQPSEVAIPADPFFAELLKRGMTVRRSRVVLGSVPRSKGKKPETTAKIRTVKKSAKKPA